MSYEPVDVFVSDTTSLAAPVSGVVVKVFSQDGTLVYGQATTDQNGRASFLLPSGFTFSLRFYKFQANFTQPQLITVLEAVSNVFDVKAELFVPPVSTDPRLCIAYGFFRTVTGAPAKHTDVIFISRFTPIWLDGAGVLTERAADRTDEKGYLAVPLIRCAQYDVTIQGYEDMIRTVFVPDALNVNLPDLLFPIVQSVVFDPPGPYTLAVGAEIIITTTVLASDGRNLGAGIEDVIWSTSNDAVAAVVGVTPTTITLRGLAAGTAEVRVARLDRSIIHIPDSGITGVPVAVTVT